MFPFQKGQFMLQRIADRRDAPRTIFIPFTASYRKKRRILLFSRLQAKDDENCKSIIRIKFNNVYHNDIIYV